MAQLNSTPTATGAGRRAPRAKANNPQRPHSGLGRAQNKERVVDAHCTLQYGRTSVRRHHNYGTPGVNDGWSKRTVIHKYGRTSVRGHRNCGNSPGQRHFFPTGAVPPAQYHSNGPPANLNDTSPAKGHFFCRKPCASLTEVRLQTQKKNTSNMTPTLLTHRTKPTPGGPAGLYFTAKKNRAAARAAPSSPKSKPHPPKHTTAKRKSQNERERETRDYRAKDKAFVSMPIQQKTKKKKRKKSMRRWPSLQPRPLPRPHLLLEAAVHGLSRAERVSGQLPPPAERRADHGSAVRHVEHPVLLQHLSQDKSTAAIKSLSSSRSTEPARARPARS